MFEFAKNVRFLTALLLTAAMTTVKAFLFFLEKKAFMN